MIKLFYRFWKEHLILIPSLYFLASIWLCAYTHNVLSLFYPNILIDMFYTIAYFFTTVVVVIVGTAGVIWKGNNLLLER